jgi:hypothetical protein
MNALGGIGFSNYELYARQYEAALEADVSSVNDTEAEYGAAQSDALMLSAKQSSQEERAGGISNRHKQIYKFGQKARQAVDKKDSVEESTCPIDKARSQSLVGQNAPLNWLVADQMGGYAAPPEREDFHCQPELSLQDPGAVLFAESAPAEAVSGGTLLSQEWLLSPCA